MSRRVAARCGVLAFAAFALGACGAVPGPQLHIDNQTDVAVAIHVNDTWVGTYPAGARTAIRLPEQTGAYDVEARSPSGAVLTSLIGSAAMVEAADAGEQALSAWNEVPCGVVALAIGPVAPPVPAPDQRPEPCP
ncbi:MAG TPA: hypothetical protein VD763_03620 [Candidatus Saccharimonadales bacterium]|nr:hypothetical protein [Candidatus Saccharimonadales bacterium]